MTVKVMRSVIKEAESAAAYLLDAAGAYTLPVTTMAG
jgi:hypothetical protein